MGEFTHSIAKSVTSFSDLQVFVQFVSFYKMSPICLLICLFVCHASVSADEDVSSLRKQLDVLRQEGARYKNATDTTLKRLVQRQEALYNMAPLITSTINNLVADTQKNRMSLKVVVGKQNRLFAMAPIIQGQLDSTRNATMANKQQIIKLKTDFERVDNEVHAMEKRLNQAFQTLGQLSKQVEKLQKDHHANY